MVSRMTDEATGALKDAIERLKNVPVWRIGGQGYSNPVRVKGLQDMGKDWKKGWGEMLDIEDLPNKDGNRGEWNVSWIAIRYWDVVKFLEALEATDAKRDARLKAKLKELETEALEGLGTPESPYAQGCLNTIHQIRQALNATPRGMK
jgi:hypothetical protein